jgi:hypothetical protein
MPNVNYSARPACAFLAGGHMMAPTKWHKVPQEPSFRHLTSVGRWLVGPVPHCLLGSWLDGRSVLPSPIRTSFNQEDL